MKFTKQTAGALTLPEGKREHFEWDDDLPGFGIRLRQSASRTSVTWVVQGRFNSETRRESLGDVRRVALEDARTAARKWFAKIELGVDPAAQRKQARAQATATRLTLWTVTERYLAAKKEVLRPSTYNAAKHYFAVHWKPLADRPIDAIKRVDVAARLQEIVNVHGRISAARARGNLSALFGWALKEGICDANPVIATNDPAAGIQPRERVLDDSEIKIVWNACQNDDFGRTVRLLLLLGCRREEIGGLRWDEVNLETGVMTIPGTRTKNHRTLTLTLSPLALEILQSAPRRADRDFVFGSRGGAFSAWSYSTLRLNARIIEAEGRPLAPWTLHDLRRTFRTGLGKLGVAPHIAELCINHVRGGVEAIYDRHRYQPEIKKALALWADYLRALVERRERKVVAFPAVSA